MRRSLTFISGSTPERSATADAEHRRLLEIAQRLEPALVVVGRDALQAPRELRGQFVAGRRLAEQALVEQLVEQQRVRGDLLREEVAHGAQIRPAVRGRRDSR